MDDFLIRKAIHGNNLLWRCTFTDEMVSTPFYDLTYTFGVDAKFMSSAQRLSIPTNKLNSELDLIEKFYFQRNKPVSIQIDPATSPSNLETILKERGYKEFQKEEEVWWYYDLIHESPKLDIIRGLEIIECKKREHFEDHLKAAMKGYEDFKFWASLLSKSFRKPIDGINVVHYVGYMDNQPVACASLGTYFEIAFFINVAVIPEYRKRGIHTSMMLRRIKDSLELGAQVAYYQTDFDNLASIATGKKVGFKEAFRRRVLFKDQE